MISFQELQQIFCEKYPNLDITKANLSDFVFEHRVRQKCYHCKNYNVKWTCPPNIPLEDYSVLFSEYEQGAVIIYEESVDKDNFEEKRVLSTNNIHKALLYLEGELYKRNNSLAVSFIGGSCKLCKNGCNEKKCANPHLSRMPLEATGCNVVESFKKLGIDITFPITDTLYRYGLILW